MAFLGAKYIGMGNEPTRKRKQVLEPGFVNLGNAHNGTHKSLHGNGQWFEHRN
jgi:hypothetical protein